MRSTTLPLGPSQCQILESSTCLAARGSQMSHKRRSQSRRSQKNQEIVESRSKGTSLNHEAYEQCDRQRMCGLSASRGAGMRGSFDDDFEVSSTKQSIRTSHMHRGTRRPFAVAHRRLPAGRAAVAAPLLVEPSPAGQPSSVEMYGF